jgi:hypothetical protein
VGAYRVYWAAVDEIEVDEDQKFRPTRRRVEIEACARSSAKPKTGPAFLAGGWQIRFRDVCQPTTHAIGCARATPKTGSRPSPTSASYLVNRAMPQTNPAGDRDGPIMSREAQKLPQAQQSDPSLTKIGAGEGPRGLKPPTDSRVFKQLTIIFFVWKLLLLCLAAFCPGPGYDTSALVVTNPSFRRHQDLSDLSRSHRLTLNLFRWDAFYFVQASQRSYLYEQDWAFSRTYSQILRITRQCE